MMMSFTTEVTILPNAPPMMIPTAMSTTLPRIANSLNSLTIPMTLFLSSVGLLGAEFVGQGGDDGNVVALAALRRLAVVLVDAHQAQSEHVGHRGFDADFGVEEVIAPGVDLGQVFERLPELGALAE